MEPRSAKMVLAKYSNVHATQVRIPLLYTRAALAVCLALLIVTGPIMVRLTPVKTLNR